MARMLSLDNIQSLAAATPYGGDITLSSLSAATLLSAAVWISNTHNWYGAGFELTQSEKNDIEYLVAELVNSVLIAGSTEDMDFERIDSVTSIEDIEYLQLTGIDSSPYQSLKLVIQGMYTDDNTSWADHIKIVLNGESTASKYNSYARFMYNATPVNVEAIGTVGGIQCAWVSGNTNSDDGYFGNMELTIFAPHVGDFKHCIYDGMVGGDTAAQLGRTVGQGAAEVATSIQTITVSPVVGTTFLVDPSETAEPDRITMTLYGLR